MALNSTDRKDVILGMDEFCDEGVNVGSITTTLEEEEEEEKGEFGGSQAMIS